MRLYLVQHAQSKTEAEDPSRPLSEEGQATAARMAVLFQQLQPRLAAIWHSDKLRARQTAEAFAGRVGALEGLQQVTGLAPLDDVAPLADRLRQRGEDGTNDMPGDLMIVGHLPHLSRLASTLLAGDPQRKIIAFQMAGVVCLWRHEAGQWSVRWMLVPELAR